MTSKLTLKGAVVALLLALFLPFASLHAQDTTWVNTLSFDSITTRRGVWNFPDDSRTFRKVLMYYTLKCDAATTADSYACGEWDYLTYTRLYHHDGTIDSTYKSRWDFTVNGSSPETYGYTDVPGTRVERRFQYFINHGAVLSFDSAQVGAGVVPVAEAFPTAAGSGRAQFLWTAAELTAAGLSADTISGLQLDLGSVGGAVSDLRIRMGHTAADTVAAFDEGLQDVYGLNTTFAGGGWQDLQFTNVFVWNGTDNVLVEFSFSAEAGTPSTLLNGAATAFPSGIATSGNDHYLDFSGGRYVNLGTGPQSSGADPRTIEAWGRAEAFNSGGLFQAGPTGTVGADFSLRTMGTDELWRAQLWGTPDFDATLPGSKNAWHHYALTYDGTTTRMYYDGVLAASEGASANTGVHDVWLGRWAGSYFDGQIDAVRLWDAALPDSVLAAWKDRTVNATHPNWGKLQGDYRFDEGTGFSASDASPAGQADAALVNFPWWGRLDGPELRRDPALLSVRPNIVFEQGRYASTLDSVAVYDTLSTAPVMLVNYGNPAPNKQLPDDDPNHPSLPTDTLFVWPGDTWSYTVDAETGELLDSVWVAAQSTRSRVLKEWYSPEVVFELGRFITPYGIGLDLGPEGFTWIYDITDYAHLLKGDIDLGAGNQQELIDLRFAFIEGTPAREVKRMSRVWGSYASHSYGNLDNDVSLPPTTVDLHPAASNYKVRARLTGHGHNSSTGGYPHCCEWKDNTHTLVVDGDSVHDWHIWQTDACALNPVYPQGGTWPGAREGWCPGDVVYDEEIEITPFVSGSSVELDYTITPVPAGNPGMAGGNYVMAFHLMQYGAPSFGVDAELYDIVSPNSWEYHGRYNPICREPRVVIRNGGSTPLTQVDIRYGVDGGWQVTHQWTGNLAIGEMEEIILPITGDGFWQGDGSNRFTASLSNPNGVADEYGDNDSHSTSFSMPDVLPDIFKVELRSNLLPEDNAIAIRRWDGSLVYQYLTLDANTLYVDTLALEKGCYTLYLIDHGNDGLSYWAFPGQGSGFLRIRGISQPYIKTFESEFGRSIQYAFIVGDVVSGLPEEPMASSMTLFPNPAQDRVWLMIDGLSGKLELRVLDLSGRAVISSTLPDNGTGLHELDLSGQASGIYLVNVQAADGTRFVEKVVVE